MKGGRVRECGELEEKNNTLPIPASLWVGVLLALGPPLPGAGHTRAFYTAPWCHQKTNVAAFICSPTIVFFYLVSSFHHTQGNCINYVTGLHGMLSLEELYVSDQKLEPSVSLRFDPSSMQEIVPSLRHLDALNCNITVSEIV